MTLTKQEKESVLIRMELLRRKAQKSLLPFIVYTDKKYYVNWHHKAIADRLTEFLTNPEKKKVILAIPPQHGKSVIASKSLPAFALGLNPALRIAAVSYSADLARAFNRDVVRLMQSEDYVKVFPDTRLPDQRTVNDARNSYLLNTNEFEVIGYEKSYKSVGVGGGLSGRPVDLAVIDDPIKDRAQAESETYRERVWDWYMNVLLPRTHNDSKIIVIMTRWHEDDLVGRILEQEDAHEWEVIKIQAVKEANEGLPEDPREPGEALWEWRHSLEKLMKIKNADIYAWDSLYQQEPSAKGGNKIKAEWWRVENASVMPDRLKIDCWIDGAYTEKTKNDPSGFMYCAFDSVNEILYVTFASSKHMEMPEALDYISEQARHQGLDKRSRIYFEPKASGKSMRQMLFKKDRLLNPVEISSHLVGEGKEARIQVSSPKVESGRVVLIKGYWNDEFIGQHSKFPKAKHDEYVDLLGYACDFYFGKPERRGIRAAR